MTGSAEINCGGHTQPISSMRAPPALHHLVRIFFGFTALSPLPVSMHVVFVRNQPPQTNSLRCSALANFKNDG